MVDTEMSSSRKHLLPSLQELPASLQRAALPGIMVSAGQPTQLQWWNEMKCKLMAIWVQMGQLWWAIFAPALPAGLVKAWQAGRAGLCLLLPVAAASHSLHLCSFLTNILSSKLHLSDASGIHSLRHKAFLWKYKQIGKTTQNYNNKKIILLIKPC